ncbi:MAG: DUF1634 domain-containing protein [Acidobacteriaceae bacterium]|nr:DUF1634 domain-containing protein [Acidobacteriaceae bacterium]
MKHSTVTDASIENVISVLLRTGVLLSASFVLGGGIYFLFRHAGEHVDYKTFHGQPAVDRFLHQIVLAAFHLRARSIIQFGIILLIATPVFRVVVSLLGFAFERDRAYVLITAIVLAILLYSLIGGAAGLA